jgi:XTP/dITP diphosphohydrolase
VVSLSNHERSGTFRLKAIPLNNKKFLLATTNKGKAREYQSLLKGIPYEMVTLSDEGITTPIAETGQTYAENATIKATILAKESGLLTMADDSGLEVDALGGEPGVRSARYAGEKATDADRNQFLLSKLKGVPEKERTARFVCVIAIAEPEGKVVICEGVCRGFITTAPRGTHGHGYDPVFYVPELGKTMAELTMEEKNKVSHRARAAEKAREGLKGF